MEDHSLEARKSATGRTVHIKVGKKNKQRLMRAAGLGDPLTLLAATADPHANDIVDAVVDLLTREDACCRPGAGEEERRRMLGAVDQFCEAVGPP